MIGDVPNMDILTNRDPVKPTGGYGIQPNEDGTVTITGDHLNIALVAILARDLQAMVDGKIEKTEEGWKYLI